MKISNRNIGKNNKPFYIAEISGNHNGKISNAIKLIDVAKWAGADAVKLQTFLPDKMTLNSNKGRYLVKHANSKWSKKTLYDLFTKAYTPWEWYPKLKKYAKKKNIILFSSVFDLTSLDFLEKINFPAYKIASFENNDVHLINEVCKKKKPLIISSGMASFKEIKDIYKICKKNNMISKLAILKCNSSYPSPLKDTNLATILNMRKKFDCEIGLSDHSIGSTASISAISLGASIIEKHICIDKKTGIDSFFSANPVELKNLIDRSNECWKSLGDIFYGPTKSEIKSIKNRRSIFSSKKIMKIEKINLQNIKTLRPRIGVDAKYFFKILGKKADVNIGKDKPIKWKLLK